jgi:hypothetical protein
MYRFSLRYQERPLREMTTLLNVNGFVSSRHVVNRIGCWEKGLHVVLVIGAVLF